MDLTLLALAAFGLFIASVLKGATGLGYSSCALPFLAAALGLKTAITLVVIPAMTSNLALLWTTGHLKESLMRFWPFYACTLPGIAFGLMALSWLNPRHAELILGVLIVIYSLYSIARPPFVMPERLQRPIQATNISVTLASGFMAIGLLGSGLMSLPGLGASTAAIVPAMLGVMLGTRLRGRIQEGQFKTVVLVVLGLLGAGLIIR
jgi:uncharacterized membrane protein YfcA